MEQLFRDFSETDLGERQRPVDKRPIGDPRPTDNRTEQRVYPRPEPIVYWTSQGDAPRQPPNRNLEFEERSNRKITYQLFNRMVWTMDASIFFD